MMEFKTIQFELKENGIGILTLNRPEKLNAISFQMEEELYSLLDHLMVNLDCRVLILKGEGRGFCAGMDLQDAIILNSKKLPPSLEKFNFLNISDPLKRKMYHQWRISQIYVKMRKISQPIIALIHGAATGGGMGFALASDMRIASSDAKFMNAAVHLGLSGADVGMSYFLPRLIGMSRAAEILYTGRFVDAKEAEKIGLVLKVIEKEQLLEEGMKLAEELLGKSPLGLRMTKEAINLSLDSPSLETILQFENSSIVVTFSSKDIQEATSAFFEKRKAKYPLK
ncbi:MAG: enoyl-CoA hydratase/isomerase family protein [Promethearchaeota archaeon]